MRKRVALWILVLVLPLFFLGGPGYYSPRSVKAAWDLGHVLFFLPFSWLLCSFLQTRHPDMRGAALLMRVAMVVLLLGVCIELLQSQIHGRSMSLADIFRNLLGTLLAFAFFCPAAGTRQHTRFLLQVSIIILSLLACLPLFISLYDEQVARSQFPLLADFETPFELSRFDGQERVSLSTSIHRHGKRSMRIRLTTETYSGVTLFYFPRDWQAYARLKFSVYNPNDRMIALHCRVNDRLHGEHDRAFSDRFHRRILLKQGWNDLQFTLEDIRQAPASRDMDLSRIELVGIFVAREPAPLTLYLDWLRLER